MIVYTADKARFRQDVMTNDNPNSALRNSPRSGPRAKRLPFLRNNGKIKPSKNLAGQLRGRY